MSICLNKNNPIGSIGDVAELDELGVAAGPMLLVVHEPGHGEHIDETVEVAVDIADGDDTAGVPGTPCGGGCGGGDEVPASQLGHPNSLLGGQKVVQHRVFTLFTDARLEGLHDEVAANEHGRELIGGEPGRELGPQGSDVQCAEAGEEHAVAADDVGWVVERAVGLEAPRVVDRSADWWPELEIPGCGANCAR